MMEKPREEEVVELQQFARHGEAQAKRKSQVRCDEDNLCSSKGRTQQETTIGFTRAKKPSPQQRTMGWTCK